jgi:hypothetical protein
MRSIYILFPLFVALLCATTGCVVSKPDSTAISAPDYNQRVQVAQAHYCQKTTVAGYGYMLAGTAAAGYYGYTQNGGVVQQNGELREPVRAANAAIGALTGLAITNLTLYAIGRNKTTPSTSAERWLKKSNNRYKVYQKTNETSFTAIPIAAEGGYQV